MPGPVKFQIIDPASEYTFEFPLFPNEIDTDSGANWDAQETTAGKKPIFYKNTEPITISIPEVYIDYSRENVSAVSDLELLRLQHTEDESGTPPPLLVVWGEQTYRCVLKHLAVNQTRFVDDGNPKRLRLSLEFVELQEDGEGTSVTVVGN